MAVDADGPVPAASMTRSNRPPGIVGHELVGAGGYEPADACAARRPATTTRAGLKLSNQVRGQQCDGAVADDHDVEVRRAGEVA